MQTVFKILLGNAPPMEADIPEGGAQRPPEE